MLDNNNNVQPANEVSEIKRLIAELDNLALSTTNTPDNVIANILSQLEQCNVICEKMKALSATSDSTKKDLEKSSGEQFPDLTPLTTVYSKLKKPNISGGKITISNSVKKGLEDLIGQSKKASGTLKKNSSFKV